VLLMLAPTFPTGSSIRGSGCASRVDIRDRSAPAPVDLGIVGDIDRTLEALLPRLEENLDRRHLDQARTLSKTAKASTTGLGTRPAPDPPATGREGAQRPSRRRSVFTCDVGLPTVWRALSGDERQRRLIGSSARLMPTRCAGIGAQSAFPGRQVISLSGDGGFPC